jgi:hypothetical protein
VRKNVSADVWTHVEKRGPEECWPWNGSTFSSRYGRFFIGGEAVPAHRAVYETVHGPINDSALFVLHRCNNKICCNPKHLTLGTNSENQRHAITSRAFRPGASGIPGVGFDKKRGYWTASGYEMGKRKNLYTGPSKEKAVSARASWEKSYGINLSDQEI